jgi:hypothetical protein
VLALGLTVNGVVSRMQNRPLFLTNQDILLHNVASAVGNIGLALFTAALSMGLWKASGCAGGESSSDFCCSW